MENIDITDPNFALSNSNSLFNNKIFNYTNPLWLYWLYMGIFFILFFAGFIFYKYYQSKKQTYNTNAEENLHCSDEGYNIENTKNQL
jgi:cbb3-type cytochrome oxidase subunit 3